MITDVQLDALEGSLRLTTQKVVNVRICDQRIRSIAENPSIHSQLYIRNAEREGRHADHLLNAAIEELREMLSGLAVARPPLPASRSGELVS